MSVNRDDKTAGSTMEQAFENASQRATGQNQTTGQGRQPSGLTGGLLGLNSAYHRSIGRSSAGEAVSKYNTSLREVLETETQGEDSGLRLHILDGTTVGLAMSAILVTLGANRGGQRHAAVFSLLIEESAGGRLASRPMNILGQQVEITTTAGDVRDEYFTSMTVQAVIEKLGDDVMIHDAGYMVIPNEMNPDDHERVRSVLFNANNALVATLASHIGSDEPPFSIGMVDAGTTLTATIEYDTLNDENAVGLPVRSDITITLQGASRIGNQSHHERVLDITKVDGFIDLVYDANAANLQQPQNQYGFVQQQPQTQRFFPRLVITDSDSQVNVISPELELLALSTATMLSKNMAWAGVFTPNYGTSDLDLRDIGAVGYEINLTGDPKSEPKKIDTKSEGFTRENLYQLISMLVHDNLIYSRDVDEAGELTWLHGAYVGAANGNREATAQLIQSADNLTMGKFSEIYSGEPVAFEENNRIHLGYWVDTETGHKRDLREIDYLALANQMGPKGDMSIVRDFADTYDRTDVPIELRLEKRERIYQAIFGSNFKIKGYARRVTFNPHFIEALQASCEAAGLIVRPGNISTDYGKLGVRGNINASQYATRKLSGNMFQAGQSPFTNYRSNTGFFNRWRS